ncbi:hypothetical protein Tco_0343526 [Tanacetum coccineum]
MTGLPKDFSFKACSLEDVEENTFLKRAAAPLSITTGRRGLLTNGAKTHRAEGKARWILLVAAGAEGTLSYGTVGEEGHGLKGGLPCFLFTSVSLRLRCAIVGSCWTEQRTALSGMSRVMRSLALKQTRNPQSDHGMPKPHHSVSSSSAHHYGSSSRHGDDDEDDDASCASTLSHDDLLFEQQTACSIKRKNYMRKLEEVSSRSEKH